MEIYQLFFPVAITAVLLILLVVVRLVLAERAIAHRQKIWTAGYFVAQDARYAERERAGREAVLTAANQRQAS